MPTRDPRVDTYIGNAAAFARPILVELRARVHAACPDVVETIKWGMPTFECAGILAGMAVFNAHAAFSFWKEPLLREDAAVAETVARVGRLTAAAELPGKAAFQKALRRALQLNRDGTAVPRGKSAKPAVPMHPELRRALAASKKAKATFDAFAPSCQREYLEWIAEAKQDATRARRNEQAIEWLAAGKPRNRKYEIC